MQTNTVRFLRLCVTLGVASAASIVWQTAASAAESESVGSITGRVQNIATSQYLNNARVALKGTHQIVFTDSHGTYQLVSVAAGPATLEVFFTDLDVATIQVDVPSGGNVERNVDLTSVLRYGQGEGTIKLDAFLVAQERETDAQAIATNEQRFAPNIKNVMSTDSLGDILGGSVGEFLKFMPGITVDSDLADVSSINVRGIDGGMTAITNDGAPTSNIWVGTTRSVDIRSMALNDIARIEVIKVPTPATPADSLGGSVNFVGKNAFERSGRELRYSFNLVGNSENLDFKKTPNSHLDRNTYKILPGANVDFTWPISKTFGVVIAGTHARVFNEQHRVMQTWTGMGQGANAAGVSFDKPFLSAVQLLDGPRDLTRNSLSVKADWKVTPNSVLSFGHVASRTDTRIGSLLLNFTAGNNGVPTPANGVPLTYSPNFTIGATGRGGLNNNGTNQLINQITDNSTVTYRYDDGRWRVEVGASRSASQTKRRYFDAGFFFGVTAVNRVPIRLKFSDIGGASPGLIEAYDNSNQLVDFSNIANYRGNTANQATLNNRSYTNNGYVNLRRTLDFVPVPTAVQIGAAQREVMLDTDIQNETWTFMGPKGASATAPLDPYVMQVYKNVDAGYGFPSIPWMSPRRAWEAYQLDPLLYQQTEAQRVTARANDINRSQRIKETVQSFYLQGDSRLLNNRLRVLGGVRLERTNDEGVGPLVNPDLVWQRNLDGSYVRNAAGQRIRKPEAGAAGSYAENLLTQFYRGSSARQDYDGYYPSLHFSFDVTESFILRAAWAKTYGRPDFSNIIPDTAIAANDFDKDDAVPEGQFRGTLTVNNPALRPWTADNFDVSAELYTSSGGILSAGIFLKEIRDFFGATSRIATPEILAELGLDQRYLGWNINSSFNAGDARVTGAEINLRQNLRALGQWGSYFTVFANGTRLDLDGNQGASFSSFVPKSANWGFTFSRKRVSLTARWNYRGLQQRNPMAAYGPNGYDYIDARTVLDLNGSYQLTRRLSIVASANNVLNEPYRLLRYGDLTPSYARQFSEQEYGIEIAIGLRGSY